MLELFLIFAKQIIYLETTCNIVSNLKNVNPIWKTISFFNNDATWMLQ